MRLLRFVVHDRDIRTGQRKGMVSLAYALLRDDQLSNHDAARVQLHLSWLESNLAVPDRFARKRNVSHRNTHGLSWVRPDAREVIGHLQAIADVVQGHGIPVEILETERPGYVVYEDAAQVVAEPFYGR